MSKENNVSKENKMSEKTAAAPAPALALAPEPVPAPVVPPQERLQEVDRMALELAKTSKKVALSNAEKALAQNETADLAYKYVVLQICMKYGLTDADILNEDGTVVRGGAAAQRAAQLAAQQTPQQ